MKFSIRKNFEKWISVFDFSDFFEFAFRLIGEWIRMILNDENSSQGQEKKLSQIWICLEGDIGSGRFHFEKN